jgi:heme-degrading monooxygenase HmoA
VVVTVFAARTRPDADKAEDYRVAFGAALLKSLSNIPGFISYNVYACLDDKSAWLGLVRWENREAMWAWRDDPTHRAVFHRLTEFYSDFNIQHCEVYREMFFNDGGRHEPDSRQYFRDHGMDMEHPPTFEDIYGSL